MGIDIDGALLIGADADDLVFGDDVDIDEWADENGISSASPYFDCPQDERFYGFDVPECNLSDIDQWVVELKSKGEKFKRLTGVEPRIVGMQNVW